MASHGLRRGGGLKRALRSPGRYAAGRFLQFVFSVLTRRSPIGGEWVSRRGPSEGGGRSGALTQERAEITLRGPFKDGTTAAARGRPGERLPSGRPPARPPRPWEAFPCGPLPAAQSPTSDRCPPAGRRAHHQRLTASKEPEGCGVFAQRRSPRPACPLPWA